MGARTASLTILTALAMLGAAQGTQQSPPEARKLLEQYQGYEFTDLFRVSLDTYVKAEAAYKAGNMELSKKILDEFWAKYPAGDKSIWDKGYSDSAHASHACGINIGHPPCYYAMRMLTDCVDWRRSMLRPSDTMTATWTVVLVGKTTGLEPGTRAELESGKGTTVKRTIRPELLADSHELIKESTWLFVEYVEAMTKGRLKVKLNYVQLSDLEVPVETTWKDRGFSGPTGDGWGKIWNAVPEGARRETDWWWIIYPSAVPDRHPDFAKTEFITGGMGTGPDGGSPCFIIDDKWLTRKPPHLGRGDYTSVERRSYLPQWLQHEFYHHLFRIYPEHGLEKTGHDWFDRRTWPSDFEGFLEPDYYHQALHRRFFKSQPSLTHRLLYAAPPVETLKQIKIEDIVGEFVHEPEQNGWHRGTISLGQDGLLKWTNKAGAAWSLTPDLARGILRTGKDCPYYGSPSADAFTILLERDASGRHLPRIAGFSFHGGTYRLLKGGQASDK